MDQLGSVGQRDSLETFSLAIFKDQAPDGETSADDAPLNGRNAWSISIGDYSQ